MRPPVRAGQRHVEQHEVVAPFDREVPPVDAVRRDVDDVPARSQPAFQVVGHAGRVLDHQDPHDEPPAGLGRVAADDGFVMNR